MWQQYTGEELDRQYMPSRFSKLPPEETLEQYERLLPESIL